MDYEKYYEIQSDGTYTLHFPNKEALLIPKIRSIFSEFGNVLTVRAAGDAFGFRFVRYQTIEEARRCIDALKSHPTIKLLPCIKQTKKGFNQRDSKKVMDQKSNDAPNEMHKSNSRQSLKSNDSNSNEFRNFGSGNCNSQNYRLQDPFGTSSKKIYDNNAKSFQQNGAKRNNNDEETCNSYHSDRESSNSRFSRSSKGYGQNGENDRRQLQENADRNMSQLMKLHNRRGINSDTFKIKAQSNERAVGIDSIERQNNNTSAALLVHNNHEICDDAIPPLVCKEQINDLRLSSPANSTIQTTKVVMAEEVIVANVHPVVTVHYILHLFHKYNPICVSDMKTIPQIAMRYCHVYLRTPQDALEIEKKYDKFKVEGTNLIVLRPCSLERQAYGV